jgi:hypothetical protein
MNLVGAAAGLAVAIAAASAPGLPVPRKGEAGYDPNSELCKSRPVIGSRVARVRECHTLQQWEEMKRAERIGLMRQQMNGSPGCNGDPYVASCNTQAGLGSSGRDTPF